MMSATETAAGVKSPPCRCLRTKNAYGTTPRSAENWLPGVACFFLLLVFADAGSCRSG